VNDRRRQDSASTGIAAPPEVVWELVSDITRMGEWSPECRQCEWIGNAAEPGREFAFRRTGPGIGEIVWRYRIEPTATGATLTESYEEVNQPPGWGSG